MCRSAAQRAAEAVEHLLHHREDVVLLDERDLDVELRELGLAVGAQVLVAEAARDLEVALQPADHQQLLELLRRLGQRVEGAVMQAAGDQVVARALGRGRDHDRRLDLAEGAAGHEVADVLVHAVAHLDGAHHRRTPQVDVAVLQPQHLIDLDVVANGEGRRLGLVEDLERGGLDLDVAAAEVGVLGRLGALDDVAGDAQDVLAAHAGQRGERGVGAVGVGVEDDLHDAGAVAQVDEGDAAVVAAPVHPAGQRDPLADVPHAQVPAVVRLEHALTSSISHRVVDDGSAGWPADLGVATDPRRRLTVPRGPIAINARRGGIRARAASRIHWRPTLGV